MKALKAECAGPRFWLGWGGWDKLAWGCEARCPQTGLLTGGLCGLRTAPRCEEMQHYMQRQDLRGDPRASSNELLAKSTVLRQTRHYVGTALSASAFPSGPGDGPRPLLTYVHVLPLPLGAWPRASGSWPAGPPLTTGQRWGEASCMACGSKQSPRVVTSPGPKRVLCSAQTCRMSWGGKAGWSQKAGSRIQQMWCKIQAWPRTGRVALVTLPALYALVSFLIYKIGSWENERG